MDAGLIFRHGGRSFIRDTTMRTSRFTPGGSGTTQTKRADRLSVVKAYEDEREQQFWPSLAKSGLSRAERAVVERSLGLGGGRVLVVGCGTGREAFALAGLGYNVVGLDVSRLLVREAGLHARGLANLAYLAADATLLPFGDESFDYVMMFGQMLGHIPGSQGRRKAVFEATRVLRKNGLVLVSHYQRSFMDYPITYLLWRLLGRLLGH